MITVNEETTEVNASLKTKDGNAILQLDEIYKMILDGSAFSDLVDDMTYQVLRNSLVGVEGYIEISRVTGKAFYGKTGRDLFLHTPFKFNIDKYIHSKFTICLRNIAYYNHSENESVKNELVDEFKTLLTKKMQNKFKPVIRQYMDDCILNKLTGNQVLSRESAIIDIPENEYQKLVDYLPAYAILNYQRVYSESLVPYEFDENLL